MIKPRLPVTVAEHEPGVFKLAYFRYVSWILHTTKLMYISQKSILILSTQFVTFPPIPQKP
jgi:hypothetical protein